jgi:DNA polymerase-3 subunit epsilon
MSWLDKPIAAYDTETTGADPMTARIVTADVVRIDQWGQVTGGNSYLADPGVEIPEEATAIHGISTAHARQHGMAAADMVLLLADDLESAWREGVPVVAFNASFDLTVLDQELRRHHGRALEITGPVLDPFVIDKAVDRYRKAGKGGRRLEPVCKHYGVPLTNAHNSASDAEAAGRLMLAIAKRYPEEVGGRSLRELWTAQARAYREQAANLEQYKRDMAARDGASPTDIAAIVIEREWPLRTAVAGQSVGSA